MKFDEYFTPTYIAPLLLIFSSLSGPRVREKFRHKKKKKLWTEFEIDYVYLNNVFVDKPLSNRDISFLLPLKHTKWYKFYKSLFKTFRWRYILIIYLKVPIKKGKTETRKQINIYSGAAS